MLHEKVLLVDNKKFDVAQKIIFHSDKNMLMLHKKMFHAQKIY